MKYFLTILAIMGIYLIAFTEIKQAQTVSKPLEITIHVQPVSIKPVVVPVIDTANKDTFVQTLNACVNPRSVNLSKKDFKLFKINTLLIFINNYVNCILVILAFKQYFVCNNNIRENHYMG